jgi:Predicted exporters of the RND superfamily
MGLFVAFGIHYAFAMTMFFIPAFLSVLPSPKKHRRYHANEALISNIAQKAGRRITKRRLAILTVTLVIAIAGIIFIPRIVVDSELANYFNPKDPVRQGIDFINRKVAGSQLIKVSLALDPRTAEGLAKAREFQDYAESLNPVGSVFSIVDSIQTLNRVFHDNDPAFDAIPDNDEAAAQLLLLVETSLSPERLVQLVSEDYQNLCFSIQLKAVDSATLQKTADMLRAKAHEIVGPQGVAIAGVSLISNQLNHLVIISMLQSFAIAFVLIFAFVAFGFKNIPAGLASAGIMIAIVLVVFGFMGFAKIELSTATALVASITLGVGIDYLIHFSARWFSERTSGKSQEEATSRTLSLTGRGIIINAMAIIFAVIPPFFSQFRPIMYFGILCFMSILLSLIGGLAVMPAMLSAVPERFFKRIRVG